MSMTVTIDINGQVIERIDVQQTGKLGHENDPGGKRSYTLREWELLPVGAFLEDTRLSKNEYPDAVTHRRKNGALVLAAKACEFVSRRREGRIRG